MHKKRSPAGEEERNETLSVQEDWMDPVLVRTGHGRHPKVRVEWYDGAGELQLMELDPQEHTMLDNTRDPK